MILLLLSILSLSAAKVYPRTGANEVLDGVSGVMYEIPEYEDPELVLFKLLERGIMPVFTHLSAIKDITSEKDDKQFYETDGIREELGDVMTLLQTVKSKLEKGNIEVIKDVIQSLSYLENLKERLHIDADTSDASVKQLSTPATAAEFSSTASTSSEQYSPLVISLRRQYLVSDNPFQRYFALEPPVNEPPTSDSSVPQEFFPETSVAVYVAPEISSVEETSVPDHSVEVVLSLLDAPSEAPAQSLSSAASSANPSDEEIFSSTAGSVVEVVDHDEPVKVQQKSDIYISKKQELGAKGATIYKKMTWKSTNIL